VPPAIDPDSFECFEGFRETTLGFFLDQEANAAFRKLGEWAYTFVLEYWHHWPREPEGTFVHQARAAVADLRHLQGFLAKLGRENEASVLEPHEVRISRKCPALALRVKAVADALEHQLGGRRAKAARR
jgi:hypothetical protein